MGRPSIAPEMLLRATLLQAFFSVRSERMLIEQINYNLLFRWFVGLPMDAEVWHPTVFTHNRDRLLEAAIAREFLMALLALPQVKKLLSSEHFSVDGTLIDAWASMKSFRPKDGSGEPPAPGRNGKRNFHKEKRSNETHASTTDADTRLYRKADGRESGAFDCCIAVGCRFRILDLTPESSPRSQIFGSAGSGHLLTQGRSHRSLLYEFRPGGT